MFGPNFRPCGLFNPAEMKCILGGELCAHTFGASISPTKIPIPKIVPTPASFFPFTVVLLEPIFAAPPSVVAGTPTGGPQAGLNLSRYRVTGQCTPVQPTINFCSTDKLSEFMEMQLLKELATAHRNP
jgi:hypothetical protein